ncbi:hypothetical protein ACERNI_06425 [Camelimonas sp. ID_303_24]
MDADARLKPGHDEGWTGESGPILTKIIQFNRITHLPESPAQRLPDIGWPDMRFAAHHPAEASKPPEMPPCGRRLSRGHPDGKSNLFPGACWPKRNQNVR